MSTKPIMTIEDELLSLVIRLKQLAKDLEIIWRNYDEIFYGKNSPSHAVCDSCEEKSVK